jgi:trimeric autotransporter adhesin
MRPVKRGNCRRSALAVIGLLGVLFASNANAMAGNEHWDAQFGLPGPGAVVPTVTTVIVHQGRIYVSGAESTTTNTTIMVWDGAQWSTLGHFYGPPGSYIADLAFVGDTLYAGGVFTNVDGVSASCLAKWDGNTWSGVDLNGAVYALAVDGGDLYAGGFFTTNGSGVQMRRVGRWNGSAWFALGPGLGTTNFEIVESLAVTNGTVYVGGSFTNAGSLLVSNVARWDGASWSALGGGLHPTTWFYPVSALVLNGTDLYAGGQFGQSPPYATVAKWNGVSWSTIGSGFNSGVASIAFFKDLLYVTGSFTNIGSVSATRVAVWNGTSWSATGSGLSGTGSRLCPDGTNLYAGGNFLLAGGRLANALAAWNGSDWSPVGTPGRCNGIASSSIRALASDGVNVYAGGTSFPAVGTTNATRIARFDGQNWYPFGTGLNSNVTAIALAGTNVYAAGDFTGGSGGPSAAHLAHWDGTYWSPLTNVSFPSGLTLDARGNDLFVAGYFTITGVGGTNADWLTRWDGTNFWSVLAYGQWTTRIFYLDGIGYSAMAIQNTNIYLSGHFSIGETDNPGLHSPTNCDNVMRFDGKLAHIVGTGLSSNATAIAVIGTNVYFAGLFTTAGGVPVSRIAKWDGNSWSSVGGGIVGNGMINALAAVGTNLYAGGTFTNMGGVTVSRIARWDGNSWSSPGSGVSSTVYALTGRGPSLYAGGVFRIAGSNASYFIGRWNESANFNTPQLINPAWLTNSQFRARLFGISGLTNIVLASTNFRSWTPILTNYSGVYDFTDTAASNYPRRFYRAQLGP